MQGENTSMALFNTLYIDMNSFFASVEQQVNPTFRGKPVGITALTTETGCVVAASVEAKALGVKNVSRVSDVKRICPQIILTPSRHRLYVRFNQRIAAVLDQYAELERVRSVDEFQIALGGDTAELGPAIALTKRLKKAVRQEVGSQLRFSAGIGPNQLLAKIAGKLEKPDGLQWLSVDNMPDAIAHLELDDLPGISRGTNARLFNAGIKTIPELYALDPRHARMIWHSVEGERFVRALQGENIPLQSTNRNGYGNSKVLAPENKTITNAYHVSRWLVEKSAHRLRRDGYVAQAFSVYMGLGNKQSWSQSVKIYASQDTRLFLDVNKRLWRKMYDRHRPYRITHVGVHLGNVCKLEQRSGEMLLPFEAGLPNDRETLGATLDHINTRFGIGTIKYGINKPHPGFFERE
jgi:DNA polymerase-4